MYGHSHIARSSVWEIECQLEAVERNIEQTELLLKQLEFQKRDLQIALCLKRNGEHKFENGVCVCGAMDPNKPVTSFKGI